MKVSADVKYYFNETFRDFLDVLNKIPDRDHETGKPNYLEAPGGQIYKIIGEWRTHIDAVIKKDSTESQFPDF